MCLCLQFYNLKLSLLVPENSKNGCFDKTNFSISFFMLGRGVWGWDDSHVFIGNMKRGVDIISTSEKRCIDTLVSPEMTAIPCRFDVHPHKFGMLAGATSGGQVYLWTASC